ncbi:MAG: hypothetical protein ABJG47_10045 [Ekhidna sp.]
MRSLICFLFLLPFSMLAQDVIYFSSSSNSRGRDLYAMTSKKNSHDKLTYQLGSGHYPHFNSPKLSPDGTTLVFQSDPDGHDRYTIWTMKTDGSSLKKITQREGMYPNWSPDGKTIIFSGRRNGIWEILTIPASGGTEQLLTKNYQAGTKPKWGATCSYHPNGKSIIYSYIREKVLYSYNFEDGKSTQLSSNGSYTHPIYAKDGRIAVNRKIDESYHLVIIENGEETVIAKNVISYSAPDWYSNESKLLFVGMVNGNQELFTIDLKTREETQLTKNNDFDAMPVAY